MNYEFQAGGLKDVADAQGAQPKTYGETVTLLIATAQRLKKEYGGQPIPPRAQEYGTWTAIAAIAQAYGARGSDYKAVQMTLAKLKKDIETAGGLGRRVGEQIGTVAEVEADCTFHG